MQNTTVSQVVSALKKFKHASRTNLSKMTLTNHDALAFAFWKLGSLTPRQCQDIIAEWRFGTSERKKVVVQRYDYKSDTFKNVTQMHSPIGLLHMFNTCSSGGYSFVADRAAQRGHVMCASGGSYVYRARGVTEAQIAKKNKEEAKLGSGTNRDYYYLRRTYWYRLAKGVYAPTVECAKRMSEIGHAFV